MVNMSFSLSSHEHSRYITYTWPMNVPLQDDSKNRLLQSHT